MNPQLIGELEVVGFPAGWLRTNCYIVSRRGDDEALIIDPGEGTAPVLQRFLYARGQTPHAVLLTHGHLDHIWNARRVCNRFGVSAFIHRADRPMLVDPLRGVGPRLTQRLVGSFCAEPENVVELAGDEHLTLAGIDITVAHTPGHTPGSAAFQLAVAGDGSSPHAVCTGDTLFDGTVGRTDFGGSSSARLLESITNKLLVLADDTVVLPGHGRQTTIGLERRTNRHLTP